MSLAFKHVFWAYLGCVGGRGSSFRTAELKKEAIYLINEINHEDSDIHFILFIEYTTANNISKR